jgi:hypothetical protein
LVPSEQEARSENVYGNEVEQKAQEIRVFHFFKIIIHKVSQNNIVGCQSTFRVVIGDEKIARLT